MNKINFNDLDDNKDKEDEKAAPNFDPDADDLEIGADEWKEEDDMEEDE